MAQYKVIDGVLYQSVDTAAIRDRMNSVMEQVRPYKDGIQQCENQIREYKEQITTIVQSSGLNREVVRALDPEKADFLGL